MKNTLNGLRLETMDGLAWGRGAGVFRGLGGLTAAPCRHSLSLETTLWAAWTPTTLRNPSKSSSEMVSSPLEMLVDGLELYVNKWKAGGSRAVLPDELR